MDARSALIPSIFIEWLCGLNGCTDAVDEGVIVPRESTLIVIYSIPLQIGYADHASLGGAALTPRRIAALGVCWYLQLDDARHTTSAA